jgi:broad specificity phosphatase PhoE
MAWFGSSAKTPQGLAFGRELLHEEHRGHRKLLLVRHGQTDYNVKHMLPGQLPGIPLNEEGLREAQATALAIQTLPLTTIIASPLERTMQTAGAINTGRSLTIREERDLLDTDYGPYSGQSYDTLDAQNPQWKRFITNANFAPKGVETFAAVQKRAVRAAERWRTAPDAGEWVALVTHADLVKLIIGHYLGIPIGNIPLINMDNAAISLLTFHPEIQRAPTLLCFNWTSPALWLSAAQKQ